jgi:branched-chain amino acid transport system substrate-binding protein
MPITNRVHNFIANITQRVAISLFALFALLMLVSCGKSYDEVKAARAKAVNKSDTINIAVIWDKEVKEFMLLEGIMQAVDEINEKGGVFGRKITIKVFYSKDDADEQNLARKVARDTSFAAVIGHRNSTNAIPASVSYEYYGLLFVAPSTSNYNLTNHGFGYTFRTIKSDGDVGHEIAVFMKSQGQKKIAIIDDRSVYGKELADGVMEALADEGLITAVRRHYSPGKTDFKPLCADIVRHEFDAMFIGGLLPHAADFIREARQMGMRQRVYGGNAIDSRALERIAGSASNGTVVTTSFNVDLDNPVTKGFVQAFRKRYGKPPDTRAALGYDSLKILAEAMKRSKSANPSVVASNMRFIKNWQGVTGSYTYNHKGDLVGKKSYFKYLNQTRFIYFDAPEKVEDSGMIKVN